MSPSAGHPQVTVLIADDSAFMRSSLTRMIESDEGLSVIGTAQTGLEALAKINSLQPDVVTLDIDMPGMDGLQTLKRVMSDRPRPIIIVSSLARGGAEATIEALALGAFDCIAKSLSYGSEDVLKVQNELISKIKAAAAAGMSAARLPQSSNAPLHLAAAAGHSGEVHSGELRAGEVHARNLQAPEVVAEQALVQHAPVRGVQAKRSAATTAQVPSIIAIGTSTGGPKALQEILSALPGNLFRLLLCSTCRWDSLGPLPSGWMLSAHWRCMRREMANSLRVATSMLLRRESISRFGGATSLRLQFVFRCCREMSCTSLRWTS
jgi:two-component system chemotaxis response regulator CheB